MKKKKPVEEGKHDCTFTVTIAKASEADPDLLQAKEKGKLTTRHDAIKAQTYFHCSYKLLPGDKDAVKTDIVTFGIAAKLYADNESTVLRTWTEGKLTWVAWKNSHKVEVTKDTLLKLFQHEVEVKMWDSKDRVSTKARFDRPKGFKMPQSRGSDEVDYMFIREILEKENIVVEDFPRPPHQSPASFKREGGDTKERPSSGCKKVMISDPDAGNDERNQSRRADKKWETQDEVDVKVHLDKNNKPEFNKLLTLASTGIKESSRDDDQESFNTDRFSRDASQDAGSEARGFRGKVSSGSTKGKRRKTEQQAQYVHQYGLASVRLEMSEFFTGTMAIANKLSHPIGTIDSLVVTISLDCPLLSVPQTKLLNPMIITLGSVSNLPSLRTHHDKNDSFKDTYACYQFYNNEKHYTTSTTFSKKIHFNDSHVVLLGTHCKEKLLEYFQGPPLQVEIHDRDRAWIYKKEKCQAFGTQEGDLLIGDVSYLSGLNTSKNPFLGKERPWDPYGIAKVDLSGLLNGEKFIDIAVPVCNCPLPDPMIKPVEIGTKGVYIPNYLESGSELKMRVEVAHSLVDLGVNTLTKETSVSKQECPFNRIVYILNYNNGKMLQKILSVITSINATALNLEGNPKDVLDVALSTYKLTEEEKTSKLLDIITGFQVVDGSYHIFVLEGLQLQGISCLWNSLPQGSSEENGTIKVAYNSSLLFSERLYVSLDVDITRVRLHKPLAELIQQPLLYVRDMIPKPCYEAVVKLHELSKTNLIKDAVRNDLFPSAESIVSLSKEFGIPLTIEDMQELEARVEDGVPNNELGKSGNEGLKPVRFIRTSRAWTPIEYRNLDYETLLGQRKVQFAEKDFVELNKVQMRRISSEPSSPRISCHLKDLHLQRAHNYSSQSLNSTVKAKEKLRETINKKPGALYTYSKEHHTATFEPVDMDQLRKEEKMLSKKMWQTERGFTYPGMKTFLESNVHQKKPDVARLDEIHKPWKENILHSNILKPTVNRIVFPWSLREHDFDVLKAPIPYFGTEMPPTIFLTGDTLKAEQREAAEREKEIWKKKLVVDDPLFYTHRCLVATELTEKGADSSSKLARLEDILKGPYQKFSLSSRGMKLDRIPAVSVLFEPKSGTRSKSVPVQNSSNIWSSSPGGTLRKSSKSVLEQPKLHSVEHYGQ